MKLNSIEIKFNDQNLHLKLQLVKPGSVILENVVPYIAMYYFVSYLLLLPVYPLKAKAYVL